MPNVPFTINGTKLIGTAPNVYKWTGNFSTDSSGIKNVSDVEWDVFSFLTDGGFYLAGTNPISPISVLPDSNQNVDLVISLDSPAFLLVNVKDASTGLPISGATVSLTGGTYDQTLVTDQGYLRQTDWSGGSGQLNFTDPARYHSSDGNIEVNDPAGELKLVNSLGAYVAAGALTSSIFDAGAPANWSKAEISPTDQPLETGTGSVKFQIATSLENIATTTWNFLGPDGTAGSFYTITDNNINPLHDGDRYIRYKIFLSTADQNFTPNVSDFVISFSSSCIPPGQATFSNLELQNYRLEVQAPGFISQVVDPLTVGSDWQIQDILLSP